MAKHYLTHKQGKKSFAIKGISVLVVLAIIFAVVLIRFAMSGSKSDSTNGLPSSDEAYLIAKQFIQPTIKFSPANFQGQGYQCAQKPDSTYIIKSYVESINKPGEKNLTTFEITLKFVGGLPADKKSWKVLNLTEN